MKPNKTKVSATIWNDSAEKLQEMCDYYSASKTQVIEMCINTIWHQLKDALKEQEKESKHYD